MDAFNKIAGSLTAEGLDRVLPGVAMIAANSNGGLFFPCSPLKCNACFGRPSTDHYKKGTLCTPKVLALPVQDHLLSIPRYGLHPARR